MKRIMSPLQAIFAAAALLAGSARAGLLYEPDGYAAQGNLVLQLDGIRNAGADRAHDPAATQWIDLAGDPVSDAAQISLVVTPWRGGR